MQGYLGVPRVRLVSGYSGFGYEKFHKTLDLLHNFNLPLGITEVGDCLLSNVVTSYTQIPLGHCHVDRNTLLDVCSIGPLPCVD